MAKKKKKPASKKLQKKKPTVVNKQSVIQQAEQLVSKKPKEFIIGFIVLFFLFVLSVVSTGYLFLRSGMPSTIKNYQKLEKANMAKPDKKTETSKKAEYYVLQANESLWDVANKVYGNPYLYTKIIELNNLANPNLVEQGMRLRIR